MNIDILDFIDNKQVSTYSHVNKITVLESQFQNIRI